MKKTMAMLIVALLSISSVSVSSTYAADDFEALLNALNDGDISSESTGQEEAPADDNVFANMDSGEMDFSELENSNEQAPVFVEPTNNTFSNEASVEFEPETTNVATNIEFEPETTVIDAPILETTDVVESDIYTAPRGDSDQLTMTGTSDYIYGLLIFLSLWLVVYKRRKNA